jgi:hypothetical protein
MGETSLTREQILALRPFLRCLGGARAGGDCAEWAFMPGAREALGISAFINLHDAFRPHLLFSDVYGDGEPVSAARDARRAEWMANGWDRGRQERCTFNVGLAPGQRCGICGFVQPEEAR